MRQGEGNAISVNGGRPEGNNYTLDGLVNTDAALVTPAVILSQDAIQEFKVSSGTYPQIRDSALRRSTSSARAAPTACTERCFCSTAMMHSMPSRFRRQLISSRGRQRKPGSTAEPVRICRRWTNLHSQVVRRPQQELLHGELRGLADYQRSPPGGKHAEPRDPCRGFLRRNLQGARGLGLPGGLLACVRNGGLHEASSTLDSTACPSIQLRASHFPGNEFRLRVRRVTWGQ